jgi:hypothetical protein
MALKEITKDYFDSCQLQESGASSWETDRKEISSRIYNFLILTSPFDKLLLSLGGTPELIDTLLMTLEKIGIGYPLKYNGHCPAISAFFFEDILSCLVAAHKKEDTAYMNQLSYDIQLYFSQNSLVFKPTLDPRP